VRQFEGLGLPHYVLVSTVPYFGDVKPDDTHEIASKSGAIVWTESWESAEVQRNWGLDRMRENGIEWALVVDADEFYTRTSILTLLQSIHTPTHAVVAPKMSVYWKTPEYRLFPDPQPDTPIVAIRTDQRFTKDRLAAHTHFRSITPATLHHLSYVRTDEEMEIKLNTWPHAHEIRPNWYEEVWLRWTPESRNLHPVVPHQFAETARAPVPDEIGALLK
jgi:hypothetical protein